jgi:hypothetical protein
MLGLDMLGLIEGEEAEAELLGELCELLLEETDIEGKLRLEDFEAEADIDGMEILIIPDRLGLEAMIVSLGLKLTFAIARLGVGETPTRSASETPQAFI